MAQGLRLFTWTDHPAFGVLAASTQRRVDFDHQANALAMMPFQVQQSCDRSADILTSPRRVVHSHRIGHMEGYEYMNETFDTESRDINAPFTMVHGSPRRLKSLTFHFVCVHQGTREFISTAEVVAEVNPLRAVKKVDASQAEILLK